MRPVPPRAHRWASTLSHIPRARPPTPLPPASRRSPDLTSRPNGGAVASAPCRMPTLLVIDDNGFVRDVIQAALQGRGYAVLVAEGGEAGLALAETNHVDAAIVDVYMPGMDGFATCGNLQALTRASGHRLPVWLITGSHSTEVAARGVEAGALEVLRKPLNFGDLFRRIEEQCGKGVPTAPPA